MSDNCAMTVVDIPVSLPRVPKVQHFALLAGLEAAVRGSLISVMPLVVHEAMGTTQDASKIYFFAGLVSLFWGLMVPWANRLIPRRWMYTGGCSLYFVGMALALVGTPTTAALSLMCNSMATVTNFVCFNAYVMDYVDRSNLGRGQSLQMFYAAAPWAIGPLLGVWLHDQWKPLPFLLAGAFVVALITTFWILRLGNGKQIAKAARTAVNPLAYLGRFFAQPRLIAGWIFAVVRSTGWWVYVVYLPYFCIEQGLGNKVGGVALSISNCMLFAAPLLLRLARRYSVRISVRWAFGLWGRVVPAGGTGCAVALADRCRDDGGLCHAGDAGRGGRAAVPDVGQTLGADRDVGGLFQLPRRVLDRHARHGLDGAVCSPHRRDLCRHLGADGADLGHRGQAAPKAWRPAPLARRGMTGQG